MRPRTALAVLALLTLFHLWPLTAFWRVSMAPHADALLNCWIISWIPHAIATQPLHLFDGNIFHPERYTLAYSEPMVVQGVMAMPLLALGLPLVLTYNLLLVFGFALSAWSMAIVIRNWTGDWTAGLVAGAIFAFNAHSLSRIPHLQANTLALRTAAKPTARERALAGSDFDAADLVTAPVDEAPAPAVEPSAAFDPAVATTVPSAATVIPSIPRSLPKSWSTRRAPTVPSAFSGYATSARAPPASPNVSQTS